MPTVANTTREGCEYTVGTAGAKSEEGVVDGRSVCPEYPGLHAGYNGQDNGQLH